MFILIWYIQAFDDYCNDFSSCIQICIYMPKIILNKIYTLKTESIGNK